jgi:hypothetical protein
MKPSHGFQAKIEREAQKRHLQHVENALRLVLPSFAARFSPLGIDNEGRVFWALSPGIDERQAALDFITAATSGSGESERPTKRSSRPLRRPTTGDEEQSSIRHWSWFVAVWGTKPTAEKNQIDDDDSDSDGDERSRRWWSFHEPGEIRKVAEWVTTRTDLEEGCQHGSVSYLAKRLHDYASLLEWRRLESRFEHITPPPVVSEGTAKHE